MKLKTVNKIPQSLRASINWKCYLTRTYPEFSTLEVSNYFYGVLDTLLATKAISSTDYQDLTHYYNRAINQ